METKLPFQDSYCVDTDALITLMTFYPSNNPTFSAIWNEIEALIKEKRMFSVKYVHDEIKKYQGKNAALKTWVAKQNRKHFFIPLDESIVALAQDIIVKFPLLLKKEKLQTGENEADPYLIALAQLKGSKIVTQENKENPNRIPAVASHYKVKTINIFEFFEERGLKFVKEK